MHVKASKYDFIASYKVTKYRHYIITCDMCNKYVAFAGIIQVTINDSANNKMIKITIPVLLGQLAPRFLDAIDGVITFPVREDTSPHSAIANFRVMDPNNGKS